MRTRGLAVAVALAAAFSATACDAASNKASSTRTTIPAARMSAPADSKQIGRVVVLPRGWEARAQLVEAQIRPTKPGEQPTPGQLDSVVVESPERIEATYEFDPTSEAIDVPSGAAQAVEALFSNKPGLWKIAAWADKHATLLERLQVPDKSKIVLFGFTPVPDGQCGSLPHYAEAPTPKCATAGMLVETPAGPFLFPVVALVNDDGWQLTDSVVCTFLSDVTCKAGQS